MNCLACGKDLPAPSFKFCPYCGSAITPGAAERAGLGAKIGAAAVKAASQTGGSQPSGSAGALHDTTEDLTPMEPAPEAPSEQIAARRAAVASEAATQYEMPAVVINDTLAQPMVFHDERLARARGQALTEEGPRVSGHAARASAPTEAAPVTPAATSRVSAEGPRAPVATDAGRARIQRKQRPEDRPTEIHMPAVSDAQLTAAARPAPVGAKAAAPGESRAREPAARESAPKGSSPKIPVPQPKAPAAPRKFSETAWFMAAVDPGELVEREGAAGSLSDAAVMTDRYAPDEPLPDEVRRNFSLGDGPARPRRRR